MDGSPAIRSRSFVFPWIVAGVLALILLAVIGVWALGRSSSSGDSNANRPVYSREDFSSKVMGKTEEEVYSVMGAPDFTSKDSDTLYWHYRKCTRDPVSKENDMDAQIVFHQGKVTSVNY
jgi:hypothetical protein